MRSNQKVKCPHCDGLMAPKTKRGCEKCFGRGAPPSPESLYARSLGIRVRQLRTLGGEAYLRSLSDEARAVLLAPNRYGYSRTVGDGGMKARGMFTRVPGAQRFLIPPLVPMDLPLELCLTEEILESAGEL